MSIDFNQAATGCSRIRTILILSIMLLSPIGAPILGWIAIATIDGNNMQILSPFLAYVAYFAIVPIAYFGPFLGITWLLIGTAIVALLIWNILQCIWFAVMERV